MPVSTTIRSLIESVGATGIAAPIATPTMLVVQVRMGASTNW
ncbi:hypothetical protein MMMDOFMJ_3153 [Methylobacterium gnaphalii]|nr:hypothetical protein MMMDOFMJ_3153 [Methylobacterium gnaphalii]